MEIKGGGEGGSVRRGRKERTQQYANPLPAYALAPGAVRWEKAGGGGGDGAGIALDAPADRRYLALAVRGGRATNDAIYGLHCSQVCGEWEDLLRQTRPRNSISTSRRYMHTCPDGFLDLLFLVKRKKAPA